jgi:hypothetical protein
LDDQKKRNRAQLLIKGCWFEAGSPIFVAAVTLAVLPVDRSLSAIVRNEEADNKASAPFPPLKGR